MKKRLLSVLLASAMVVSMVACGGSDDAANNNATNTEVANAEATGNDTVDYGSGEIKIWVAENVVDFTKTEAEKFLASNEAFAGYTVVVEPVGEGDAANNMLTDVEGGADIFGFAQDQLARLVSAGALNPVVGDYAAWVSEQNDAGAASAAVMGDMTYAFPVTSDNGYFLYYDKSVITDPTSLEQIVADAEKAGKNFYFEINSGWYQPAFFFGTGCTLTYDTDANGNFVKANVDYNSEKGLVALKEIIELSKSASFQNGSSCSNATNVAAIVDGTWDAGAAKEIFGENYACAKLPSFTGSDGNTYQLGGFGGFKLLGVKPQTEAGKLQVCLQLAQYLSSADVQIARYNAVAWGPSNVTAQADASVQADEALAALGQQLANTIPQGQYPNDYWTLATSLGDSVIADEYDNATDDELMTVLATFQSSCESYVQ